jgi:Ca-activated chloride channel family protein
MSFVNPEYLFLLFFIPILFFIGLLGFKKFIERKRKIINISNFKKMSLEDNDNEKFLSKILWLIVISLIIISIARPISGEVFDDIEDNAKDIVFALDISDSMKARDVNLSGSYSEFSITDNMKNLSRLEAAKKVIKGIVKGLNGDRVSLIAFSDTSFPLSPLSNDYDSFYSYLNDLDYSYLNEGGTSINNALEVSEKRFINKESTKIIIIISDGEEQNDKALTKSIELKKKDIKVISIGIGSREGSKILLGKDSNDEELYKTYLGQDVITKLNSELLKNISKKTNGKFFELGNENISQTIINNINKYKSNVNKIDKIRTYRDIYQVFVIIALLILIFELLIKKIKLTIKNI